MAHRSSPTGSGKLRRRAGRGADAQRREASLAIFEGRQTLHAGPIDVEFLEHSPTLAPWSMRN